MKIVDTFCFCGSPAELDLLEVRLNELDDVVSHYVLVEANKTQSLLDKPFNFELNKERYAKFLSKITYVKVEDCPSNDKDLWTMEHFQRNCIMRGLEILNLNDEDLVMVSDLDEIPREQAVKHVIKSKLIDKYSILVFDCDFFAYFLNLKALYRTWVGTSITTFKIFKSWTPQVVKDNKNSYAKINNGGFHFSWLGGAEEVWKKAHNCIEPYDKSQIPSKEEFIKYFKDFIEKDKKFFIKTESLKECLNEEFGKIEIDQNYPLFILNNLEKFSKYILI